MNVNKLLLAGALLAIVGVGVAWYATDASRPGMPSSATAIPETTSDSPSQPTHEAQAQAPSPRATGASRPSPATPAPDANSAAPEAAAEAEAAKEAAPETSQPQDARQRATEELMREMVATAYREQGSRYVDYLVSSGLARVDAERLVERGFRDTVECSFDAMRAEAEAESVPFDTVLYAVEAMFYNGDGPLLRGVIDMEAVANREMPCILNVLQEVGIPAHVLQEIQGTPVASEE